MAAQSLSLRNESPGHAVLLLDVDQRADAEAKTLRKLQTKTMKKRKRSKEAVAKQVTTQKERKHPWRNAFFFGKGPTEYKIKRTI